MGGGLGAVVTFYLNTECSLVNVDGAAPTVMYVYYVHCWIVWLVYKPSLVKGDCQQASTKEFQGF
jgi:hypothetical protein